MKEQEPQDLPRQQGDLTSVKAISIYQEHLDVLTEAVMENDFPKFNARISLPHHIQNINAEFHSNSEDEMQSLFHQAHQIFKFDGITSFIRLVTNASFVSPTVIVGEHLSEMLRGTTRALPPYRNCLRLVVGNDGIWRETHSVNAIAVKSGKMGLYDLAIEGRRVPETGLSNSEPS
ncbi:MAG: hypothetical protein ABJL67_00275 [Sulfitobacter sp.]